MAINEIGNIITSNLPALVGMIFFFASLKYQVKSLEGRVEKLEMREEKHFEKMEKKFDDIMTELQAMKIEISKK